MRQADDDQPRPNHGWTYSDEAMAELMTPYPRRDRTLADILRDLESRYGGSDDGDG